MKQGSAAIFALVGSTAEALHVTQWMDSLSILPGHFIEISNSNTQDFLAAAVDSRTQLQQDFAIDLVSAGASFSRKTFSLSAIFYRQTTT